MAAVYLGVDVGTTELKMAVIEAGRGKVLAKASQRIRTHEAPDGTREQNAEDMIQSLQRVSVSLRRDLGQRWKTIEGIGFAAQGGSAMIVDRSTGEPFTPLQLWSDTRPLALLPEIASRRPKGYWRRISRTEGPGHGLARMEWLRRQYPAYMPPVGRETDTRYCGIGEYIGFRLTGEWRQDPGNALQMGCYSVRGKKLVRGPLDTVGVPLSFVSPLREGHEIHPLTSEGASLLGLSQGIQVAGPYIDHEAGYLSCAGVTKRPLQCSLGTAWVGNFVVQGDPSPFDGLDLILPSPVKDGSLVLRVMLAGNASWDWGLRTLLGTGKKVSMSRLLKRAEDVFSEALLPPRGLVASPWLTRPNPFIGGSLGNGSFQGVGALTTRAQMLRALVAAMCFEFAIQFEAVRDHKLVDEVILGGGASQGSWFQTVLTGLFHPLPVRVVEAGDPSGARGAIYAFSHKAARSPVRSIPPPRGNVLSAIQEQLQIYKESCP